MGRKNRYVVVRTEARAFLHSVSGGSELFTVGEGNEARDLIRVATLPDAATASIDLEVGRNEGATQIVAFREGVRTTVDGVRFEIGPIRRTTDLPFASTRDVLRFPGLPWSYAIDSNVTDPLSSVASVPLDGDGNPIRLIDAEGKPISYGKLDPREEGSERLMGYGPNPKASIAIFGIPSFVRPFKPYGELWHRTNIDPRWIRSLRLSHVVRHRERIGPFALDPSRG